MAKKKASAASGEIFRVKVTLDGLRPAIWRRLETCDCSLADLHEIIQMAMGWEFAHLWHFKVHSTYYGEQVDRELNQLDAHTPTLSKLFAVGTRKFSYVYDFGDNWQHSILIERVVEAEADAVYPRCTKGERRCPPEDCGGVWGYCDLLEALANPDHPEHEERLEWLDDDFEPEAFDLAAANKRLAQLA
jgi:hypothetical protein